MKEPLINEKGDWWNKLNKECDKNVRGTEQMMKDTHVPMNYYSPLKIIEDAIQSMKSEFILVSEGSNTMDIGRTILSNLEPRQRLDAATFGTMGVGFGFAIAA